MPKIMIVDDAEFSRTTMKRLLMKTSVEIIEASSGQEALDRYSGESPDVVLLDLLMPGQTGFETLEKILAADPGAKVIITSADCQKTTVARVTGTGAVGLVPKPVERGVLLASLTTVLGGGWAK